MDFCFGLIVAVALQFSSVTQSCPTLCDPMDCSTPGFPVHHQLPELAQTHIHQVSDSIQQFNLLSSLLLLPSIFPSIRVFSNESVPAVPVCFSSGDGPDRPLFTPLIHWSQPTIKSGSLYSRCQNTCKSVHKGVISALQRELVSPMASLLTMQSLCLSQTGAAWQDKLKAACRKMKE